jgi:hypothetical protein
MKIKTTIALSSKVDSEYCLPSVLCRFSKEGAFCPISKGYVIEKKEDKIEISLILLEFARELLDYTFGKSVCYEHALSKVFI